MATLKTTDTHILQRAILDAIEKDTAAVFDELKKELVEKLDWERNTIIAGVVLEVTRLVSYQTMGDNLVITVHKK